MKVRIILEQDEDKMWVATVPSLPGVVSQGKTKEEAEQNVSEAISLHLESLLSEGLPLRAEKTKHIGLVDVSLV